MPDSFDAFEPLPTPAAVESQFMTEQLTTELPRAHQTQYLPDDQTRYLGPSGAVVPPTPTPWWRRGPLVAAGVVVLAVVGLIVGITLSAPSTPTPTNTAAAAPAPAGTAKGHHKAKTGAAARLAPGATVVLGTVGSVSGGSLSITPDGGNPVTVTVDGTTRFAGGVKSVTDLKPGQRVELVVRNGTAVAVRLPQVRDTGTITARTGTRATLVEADGRTVALDLSGVTRMPADGNVVVVTGSVTDGGATLQVSKVAPVTATG